ncbi:hypothetical protein CEXT_171631 [Caerostris extrusa]|uniref:Uncharacterized protein n=1 Tax=Caerostris extrusa TaxID=172846 RepID=A0AAV4QWX8_CAEEX|nr:hypothetical protein CEXT_171631 [Caerostris extrusa]
MDHSASRTTPPTHTKTTWDPSDVKTNSPCQNRHGSFLHVALTSPIHIPILVDPVPSTHLNKKCSRSPKSLLKLMRTGQGEITSTLRTHSSSLPVSFENFTPAPAENDARMVWKLFRKGGAIQFPTHLE